MLSTIFRRPKAGQVTPTSEAGWSGDCGLFGAKTKSGVSVSEEIALTYEACFAATRVLAEGVGGVPLPLYEKADQNDRKLASLPVANIFKYQVNPRVPSGVFREGKVAHQVNFGNAFAEIERDPRTGNAVALWPIHPTRVSVPSNGYDYEVKNNDGTSTYLYADEMLHIPGCLSDDGIWGRGVVSYGRELIGGGIGMARAANAFLASGGQPKGVIEAPGMNDRAKRQSFREEWESVHGNPQVNVPTIAILNPGFKYTPIETMSAEANQIIQAQMFARSGVATLYGIPGYKIGAEGKETAGTIEQKAIEFITFSLIPWARKWEEQCGLKLLSDAERLRFYFEHNFSALLRGDSTARYNVYRLAIMIGVMTINECRRLENLPSIGEAGDQNFVPANLTTAERAMAGDMGNGGGLGSDMNGSPADNPLDRDAMAEMLTARLPKIQRQEVRTQLAAIEHAIEDKPIDYREGARLALMNSLAGILVKESREAQAAMEGKRDFEQWLREFYSKQEAWTTGVLASACWNLRAAGLAKWGEPAGLAAWLRARNVEALQLCYNHDTPETAARRLKAWPTDRAKELADEILAG